MATTQKYREGLVRTPGASSVVCAIKRDRPLIWVHAVSVGEVLAVSRLVKALDAALPEYFVAISTTTRTGQALARERFGARPRLLLPARPALGRPRLPERPPAAPAHPGRDRVLAQPAQRLLPPRNPVAVVNARISDRSWPRYRTVAAPSGSLCCADRRVLAQSETDADRLKAIGCRPERVTVAGNLKFDVRAAKKPRPPSC